MSASAERALYALSFWLKRRDVDAVCDVMAGVSETERADMRSAMDVPGVMRTLYDLPEAELRARMVGLAGKSRTPLVPPVPSFAHKVIRGESKTAVAVQLPPEVGADLGWFEGIANVTGVRDRQLDTTLPGSFVQTASDLTAGRVSWALTRQHSDDPADVVGYVTEAKETPDGLWVRGVWTADPVAQDLRAKVAAGARLGLSITYLARGVRPDGAGGRLLSDVDVTSVAVTNGPASPGAYIRAGKGLPSAPGAGAGSTRVVTVAQSIAEGAARRDPERERLARMARVVEAAGFPSPRLVAVVGIEAAYDMTMEVAGKAALREAQADPERAAAAAKRDRANAYCNGLADSMAREASTPSPCGGRCVWCQRGIPSRCSYR